MGGHRDEAGFYLIQLFLLAQGFVQLFLGMFQLLQGFSQYQRTLFHFRLQLCIEPADVLGDLFQFRLAIEKVFFCLFALGDIHEKCMTKKVFFCL